MYEELTKMQQEVVGLHGRNILKACPGSGKTYVVAHKIVNDLKEWKYKNKGMAILTFTNVAKDEIINTVDKISGIKSLSYPHFVGTLDSFISQYIFFPFSKLIMNCESRPSIMDDEYEKTFASYFWKRNCYTSGCVPWNFYIEPNMLVHDTKNNFTKCSLKYNRPCEKYKKTAYKKGLVTHYEVIIVAIEILKHYPSILQLLVDRFPYFIVDEAQDTSKEQMELFKLIFDCGVETALLIGDPDQSIYEWRDADPTIFVNMYNDKHWNSLELNENFRCSQNICNATFNFSTLSNPSIAKGKTANFHLKPIVLKYDDKTEVIQRFLKLCHDNEIDVNPDNVAILTRGNKGLENKPYFDIADLWKTYETALLSKACYYKGIGDLNKTAMYVEKVIWYLIKDEKVNVIDYEKVKILFGLDKWKFMVVSLSISLPSSEIPLRQWKIEIEKVMNSFLKENELVINKKFEIKTKSKVRDVRLKDFLEQPLYEFFVNSKTKDYLITTIHAVKGCTFDATMLVLNSTGKLTSNIINTKPIDSEEIRTFYVAATRAKKLFVLAVPKTVKKKTFIRFSEEYWDFIE